MTEPTNQRDNNGQYVLDSRALEAAVEARTIILEHQRTCTEDRLQRRHEMEEIRNGLAAIRIEVSRIVNRGLVWFIVIMVGAVGYFLAVDGLPGKH